MTTLVDHIDVRWRPTNSLGAFQTLKIPPSQTTVTIPDVERGVSYDIEARSVSPRGTCSDWVPVSHTVANASLTLNAPTALSAVSVADGVHLWWTPGDAQLRADTEFEVWRAPNNSGSPGTFALLSTIRGTGFTDGVTDGVLRWYEVRSKDMQGNYSAFSASVNSQGKTVENGATNIHNYTQDDLANGSKYARTLGVALQSGLPTGATLGGSNLAPNPSFESNIIGATIPSSVTTAANLCDDWETGELDGFSVGIQQNASRVRSGTNSLDVSLLSGSNVANSGFLVGGAWTVKNFPCVQGDTFYVGGYMFHDASVQEPPGVVITANVALRFYDASGNYLSEEGAEWTQPAGGSFTTPVGATVAAPANAASYKVYCFGLLQNYSGAAITTNSAWAILWFDDVFVYHVTSLDNEVADGTTYLRMPGANMDPNRRGLIDFSQGGHLGKSLANVPDGGGRYGVHAVDGNNLALIDFSQSGHVNKTVDYIPDGTTRFGSIHAPATQSGMYAPGTNLLANPTFQVGVNLTAGWTLGAGWSGQAAGPIGNYINFFLNPNASPITSECYSDWVPIATWNVYAAQFRVSINNSGLSSGDVSGRIEWLMSDGTLNNSGARTGYNAAPGASFQSIANQTPPNGSPYATHARLAFFVEGAVSASGCNAIIYAPKLEAGAVNTPFNDTGTHYGDNVTQPGTGQQVGDQRSLPPIRTLNLGYTWPTNPTYSANAGSPATATISVPATNVIIGSITVNYNAMSVGVSGTGGSTVTYYLYLDDPGYAGGSQTLVATTNGQTVYSSNGRVYVGTVTVTFPTSGGGGGTGGGGSGRCVCDDMWVDGDTQAWTAQPGHEFDCCDLPTCGTETFKRALHSVEYYDEQCVRLTTEHGAVLDCGHTTPFDTVGGRVLRALQMGAELVLTDRGLDRVVSVEPIGIRRVCYFHFGGISYAAGRDQRPRWLRWIPLRFTPQWLLPRKWRLNRIYSHNSGIEKP